MKLFKQSESYISENLQMVGDMISDANVSVDGSVKGNLTSKHHVMLGDTALFEGNIDCDTALICGRFSGKITARRWIEVKASAVVVGDLIADVVRVDASVQIQGRVVIREKGAAPQAGSTQPESK